MSLELFNLHGETAVVVGGTGALGSALASGIASVGARVAILGRNAEAGEALVKEITELGGKAHFYACDALSRESLQTVHKAICTELEAPTILINAAGGNDPKATVTSERPFEEITREDWSANFDLNLVGGALLPCQEFGGAMVKRGAGRIINIGSVSAHHPLSRVVAYSAAKAAVLSLTQFLAREWAPYGVRVNSITPGFFPAEQNQRLLFNEDGTPTDRAQSILSHTPMGRFGQASELIGAAIYLSSRHASSFVTGTDLRVDGGFLSKTI